MNIYFAGDTGFSSHFEDIIKIFGSIDYCILPIGAYKPEFMMNESHISPKEAVEAFNILNAKNFIPMHYGTYDISNEPLGEPIRKMRKMHEQGKINGKFIELAIGEALAISD